MCKKKFERTLTELYWELLKIPYESVFQVLKICNIQIVRS